MKLFTIASVAILLFAVSFAEDNSSGSSWLKPSEWLTPAQLEQTPSVDDISFEGLENMSVEKGAETVERIYHLSQMHHNLMPTFVPSPSNIPVHIYSTRGQKASTTLDKWAQAAQQQPNFGNEEVTIFITGMPATTETVKKANYKLIESYLQRYNTKKQQPREYSYSDDKMSRTSSEEDLSERRTQESSNGNLVVIDLGSNLNNFKRLVMLDTEQTGAMIASTIMEMTEKNDVADETIHIVAQGIAAHVAGAAGNEYTRRTGRQLRRITALDPSKLFAQDPHTLAGLARGDADFVDAIHTNVYGMGTIQRVGDVDFYPNGPSAAVPGAKNIVEASMRATRYYAESVRPGQERNFPAVAASSLKEYKNNDGYGKRVYMGIDTDFDVRGDYILEVNAQSPFGKRTPVHKQNSYHGTHKPLKIYRNY